MSVELGDDATYLVKGVGSISFQILLGDVVKLSDVLFIPVLKKNLLLVYCMKNVQ
jgi:hypothetical protein